jgi:hypothetical protein
MANHATRSVQVFLCLTATLLAGVPAAKAVQHDVTTHSTVVLLVYWTEPDAFTPSEAASVVGEQDDAWFAENS